MKAHEHASYDWLEKRVQGVYQSIMEPEVLIEKVFERPIKAMNQNRNRREIVMQKMRAMENVTNEKVKSRKG